MAKEKQPNTLTENSFSYRPFKNGRVSILWKNKEVLILKKEKAEAFLSRISGKSAAEKQLAMAKITGNFKRGNEREGKTGIK